MKRFRNSIAIQLSPLRVRALFFALGSLVSCLAYAADAGAPARSSVKYESVDKLIASEFSKSNGRALTVGIVERGGLVWSDSFGTSGKPGMSPATTHTVYAIQSVSKLVTGLMLLKLVDRGVVHLTDPVDRYVPEVQRIQNAFPWSPPVTLIQLATMISGINGHWPSVHPEANSWDENLLEVLPLLKFNFEPGTRREYSNIGYAILGLALSRAAHRTYAEYVQSEILHPLGMTDTGFSVSATRLSRFAYPREDATQQVSWTKDVLLPAGGIFTTLGDLAKLMRFQLGFGPETVLSREVLEKSYRLVVSSDAELQYGDGIGFSAVRSSDSNLTALGHGGHGYGFVASYEFDRSRGTGIILLTTHDTNDYKPIVRKGLQILNPESFGGTGLPPAEEH
jgi:CubicO group peptidase (beta-lactamase class C family)